MMSKKNEQASEHREPALNEIVNMTHPDSQGTAEVTYGSFKEVWEPKGWKIASSVAISAETQSVPATDTPIK